MSGQGRGQLFLGSYGTGSLDLLPVATATALATVKLVIAPADAPPGLREQAANNAKWIDLAGATTLVPGEPGWRMLDEALANGGCVLRLYPDDPLSHPAGIDEARLFAATGLSFRVIPGPSIVLSAAAHVGVPVTHVISVAELDRDAMPRPVEHAVIGVLLERASDVVALQSSLLASRWPEETPCALVKNAGLPSQTIQVAPLGRLEPTHSGRAVFLAGRVIDQRAGLAWFERLPLFGKQVLVTRARAQAAEFCRQLRALGAEPVELPAIETQPPDDLARLDQAVREVSRYDWVIFTSANGVAAFFDRVDALGLDARLLGNCRVAAIGSATASSLRERNIRPDFVPERFVAEAMLSGLLERGISGSKILIARAAQARDVLPNGLRSAGADVDVVAAYRTVVPAPDPDVVRRLQAGEIDIVTFTSSSTVTNLLTILDGRIDVLQRSMIACIGPITAETARAAGLRVDVTASEYSIPGLLSALTLRAERSHV